MNTKTATTLVVVVAMGLTLAAPVVGCGRVPAPAAQAGPVRQDEQPRSTGPASTTAAAATVATAPPGYPGFEGPAGAYLTTLPEGGKIIVLESSVSLAKDGNWRAWGLVRNETPQDAGEVTVSAELLDAAGEVVAAPSTAVPVMPLRSGEPGPFAIWSAAPARSVARVKWRVTAGSGTGNRSRDVRVLVYWQVPYGVPEWRGVTRKGPPYPHEAALGLENPGVPLRAATATIAWLDHGKVIWVETTPLDAPESGLPPGFHVPTGGAANFRTIRTSDPQVAAYGGEQPLLLYSAEYWLWGQGQPD